MAFARLIGRLALGMLAASLAPAQSGDPWGREAAFARNGALTAASSLDAEAVARAYLEARGWRRAGVVYALEARSNSFGGAVEHLVFTPFAAGVPYFDAAVQVHVDRQGRVVRFEGPANLPSPRDLAFQSDAASAVKRAAGGRRAAVLQSGGAAGRRTALQIDGAAAPAFASQTWFGVQGAARPAWTVYLEPEGGAPEQVVVDAETQAVLYRRSLAQQAEPDGYVFPAPETQNPGKGGYALRFLSGRRDARGRCPAPIYPSVLAFSGECWSDGASTIGNNVEACADLAGNDVCEGRASGAAGRFLYPFQNAYEIAANPAADLSAALVNAFYWTNIAHDWLYDLGFDEASGNFQQDNFGRGGAGSDRVRVDVQDGATWNNAWFSTPPDGIAPRMQLGLWSATRRDSAFDGDVILHEYIHGLTNRLVGGPADAGALFLWHSGALGEGWSDALAASFTNDPVIGEYVTKQPATGVRTVRYDQSALTFGGLGTRRLATLPGTSTAAGLPSVHRDGEIWASALWDVRKTVGREVFEPLVVAALKLTPRRPSMLAARDALLQAAALAGLSAAEVCAVWGDFAARGMGASAALNPIGPGEWADTALSVFEAFDAPASCGGSQPAPGAPVLSEGAESDAGWSATGLWHRTSRRAASGTRSWWFGREETGTYDAGTRVSGALTSPVIDLTGRSEAILEWKQVFRGEGFLRPIDVGGGLDPYLNADSGRLWISRDGGASWSVLSHIVHQTPGASFATFRVNLARYAGGSIRLRFEFDTFNALHNANEGWYLDDIRVLASGAPPILQVTPRTLTFGGAGGVQTLQTANLGGAGLSWQATTTAPWLAASPASGSGPASIAISANPAGLPPGEYAAAVHVDAGGGGWIAVPVSMIVPGSSRPVAAWSFEEGEAGPGVLVRDETSYSNHGLTAGVGTAPAEGVAGRGRLFSGASDAVVVSNAGGLTPLLMTVRIWVKLLAFPSSFGVIASQFGGASSRGWYLAAGSSGEVILMGAQPPSSAPWLTSAGRLTPGKWHHVTATIDRLSGQARIYFDGKLDRTGTFPGVAADPDSPLVLGRASWTNGYALNAVLDEAVILPSILPAHAVALDYAAFSPPAPVPNSAVAANWTFDAGAQDVSGNGFHAYADGGQATSGVRGAARRFGQSDAALRIPLGERLSASSFTVRAWVRPTQPRSRWTDLVSNYGGDFTGWRLGLTADGRPFFAVASKPNRLPSVEAAAPLQAGRWTALAGVYDGAKRTITLYVDGRLAGTRAGVQMTPRAEGEMAIGGPLWVEGHGAQADIDEALVAPRAWSVWEISGDLAWFSLVQRKSN